MTAQKRPDRMDEPFDVEDLARTLDEVILRSPISPTKAWEYYRLTFADDHNAANWQTTDPGGSIFSATNSNQCETASTSTFEGRLQPTERKINISEFRIIEPSPVGGKCANVKGRLTKELTSSLIRSQPSANNTVNGYLAEEQKGIHEPTEIHSGKLSQATTSCSKTNSLKQSRLLFTTEHIGTHSVALSEHNSKCLPLSGEKVKVVSAVQRSEPIDIHGLTFPYADEGDFPEAGRYETCHQQSQSLPDRFPISDTVKNIDQAAAMSRYGYTSGGDSSYRRFSSGNSSLLPGYRKPIVTQRSSYRPTMISSLSYTNKPRDTSYISSSLRRSTSLGSDRPYYSSTSDYSSGSRLNLYQTSPRLSDYRKPIAYIRSNTAENVLNPSNYSTNDEPDVSSNNNNDGQNSNDNGLSVNREQFEVGEQDSTVGNSPNNDTPEFQKDYRYGSTGTSSRNSSTKSQVICENSNSENETVKDKGSNKATSRLFVKMNYDKVDLDSRTIQAHTSMSDKTNRSPANKNSSSLTMASANLIQDGLVDKKKVVSQLTLNSSPEKQHTHKHIRQIRSRTDDSTTLTSENYMHNSERSRSPAITRRQITDKTAVDSTCEKIDSKLPEKPIQLTLNENHTGVENRPQAESNSYPTPSYRVTAKPWQSTMGANVQSTQSSESAEQDSDVNMDGQSRRYDSRDSYRNRHKSEEEDYVLTESTASFVYKNGEWVSEDSLDSEQNPQRARSDMTSSSSVTPAPVPWYRKTPSQSEPNSENTSSRYNRSYSRDVPDRSTSVSSTGSIGSVKYESATSGPDSPGLSSTSFHSKGAYSGSQTDDRSPRQNNHAAMDLYTERMNIISGFDKERESHEREPQNVVTEKLQIPFSPPTFTVGDSNDQNNSGRYSVQSGSRTNSSSYQRNYPEYSGRSESSSTSESTDRTRDRSSHATYDDNNLKDKTSAASRSETYVTPYYVTEPPDEEFERQDSQSSQGGVFVDSIDSDNGRSRNDSGSRGSQISDKTFTLEERRGREEPRLFQSRQEREESRRDRDKPNEINGPAGVSNTRGPSDSSTRWYNAGNVNRENDRTASVRSSQVNKTGSGLTSENSNKGYHNEVTVDGSDAKFSDRDASSVGEKISLSANQRLDTVSTTARPAPATQLSGNTSASSDSLQQDDDLLDRDSDTRGFSQLESMSNNQISERRGGIYYSGNISRRNVTGLLASEHEDRRRALALSQTETQRVGEMVQTNDKPGNRSELRQTHAGQTSTRKAAGVEVSKDGDLSRSRDVTDTIDRSRTDTEFKSENSIGGVDVSKVREDRQVHRHQDRHLQSEIKKDGREVRQSSSSQSESAKVSRVTESGDSRVSQRQERHFKSSKVTKSSRTSGSSFSSDNSLRQLRFGSDDSDEEGTTNKREIEAGSSSNEVDRYTEDESERDSSSDPFSDPYRETIVHENKAAELLTNLVTRTDREGIINLSEERQRGVLDRGVTRNISDEGGLRTQRVQQRSQVQSARRTASSSNYSRTSRSTGGDSGTVSAEDEEVILAALIGRLGEKEVEPFSAENFPTAMRADDDSSVNIHAILPLVRNTEDVEDDPNALSPEEQAKAIAQARQHLEARQVQVRKPVARKRTLIVDEEMMEEIFLRCIICRDRYDTGDKTPKLLPCHHTFCLECLREMYRVESETRQSLVTVYRDSAPSFVTIHCPTCRASHMINDREFKSYKSDHKLLELLEISASPSKGNLGYCKTHRTQITDHFCETCLQAVCIDCKVLDHRDLDDHIVYSREEALRLYASQACRTLRDVDTEDRQLEAVEKKLKDAIEVIDGKLTSSEQLIRQTFDKFKVAINDRQDHLLGKIENEMGTRRTEFSDELSEITKRMETIEKTQTTTKQAQEEEDVEQMFTAHQNAREMFKNNFEVTKEPKSNIKSSFFYEKRDRANIMNTVSDHGMMTFQS